MAPLALTQQPFPFYLHPTYFFLPPWQSACLGLAPVSCWSLPHFTLHFYRLVSWCRSQQRSRCEMVSQISNTVRILSQATFNCKIMTTAVLEPVSQCEVRTTFLEIRPEISVRFSHNLWSGTDENHAVCIGPWSSHYTPRTHPRKMSCHYLSLRVGSLTFSSSVKSLKILSSVAGCHMTQFSSPDGQNLCFY